VKKRGEFERAVCAIHAAGVRSDCSWRDGKKVLMCSRQPVRIRVKIPESTGCGLKSFLPDVLECGNTLVGKDRRLAPARWK
jgi:hypothetical protein